MPPVALAVLAIGAQYLLARKRAVTPTSGGLACVVVAGSAWCIGGSIAEFRRRRTTVNPVSVGADFLVTSGPNRLTRNPMYVGMTGVLLGHAVFRRSPLALVPAVLFAVAID